MGLLAQQFRHKRVPHYYDVIARLVRIWPPGFGAAPTSARSLCVLKSARCTLAR